MFIIVYKRVIILNGLFRLHLNIAIKKNLRSALSPPNYLNTHTATYTRTHTQTHSHTLKHYYNEITIKIYWFTERRAIALN